MRAVLLLAGAAVSLVPVIVGHTMEGVGGVGVMALGVLGLLGCLYGYSRS